MLAGGIYGLTQLKQDFDPDWFLPADSKIKIYGETNDKVNFHFYSVTNIHCFFIKYLLPCYVIYFYLLD